MVTSHDAEVPSRLDPSTANEPSSLADMRAEQLWGLHGTSLYTLACGLLGDQPAAERAVTLGMTDFVVESGPSGPAPETPQARQHLSHLVYRRCEAILADAPPARTMTLPPLVVWFGDLVQLQRTCLALCVFGGHTHRQAAKLLDHSPATVAGMLTAGLHQLADRAAGNEMATP